MRAQVIHSLVVYLLFCLILYTGNPYGLAESEKLFFLTRTSEHAFRQICTVKSVLNYIQHNKKKLKRKFKRTFILSV